jgi:DNA-binding response OmpR family regulator
MKKILVIEDDLFFQKLIENVLEEKYAVHCSDTFKIGNQLISTNNYDLFIVDITLPDGNGLDICSLIKSQSTTRKKPIIIVSGKCEIEEKLKGFEFGADDYLTKELLARVCAKFKNLTPDDESVKYIHIGPVKIDLQKQRLMDQSGNFIELTQIEFKLLVYFASHKDHILSRNQILESIWSENLSITERVIDTHISHLRKKVGSFGVNIKAVHGVGYCFSFPQSA